MNGDRKAPSKLKQGDASATRRLGLARHYVGTKTNYTKMSETRPSDSQCSCRAVQSGNLDAVAACREIRTLGAWVPKIDIRIWTDCAQQDWKLGSC